MLDRKRSIFQKNTTLTFILNQIKMFNKLFYIILPLFIITFSACEKDDPEIHNEEEVITTLIYTLVPSTGGDLVVLSFRDLDGDGGDVPVITGGTLAANSSYSASLSLLNEAESPAENINEEIEEEAEEHQFFFQANGGLNATIAYSDKDANDQPLGISTTLTTGDASQGQLTIILRHEPAKSAEGVADGNVANAGGETDIEATFDITIQ